jgi:hypothetical protein
MGARVALVSARGATNLYGDGELLHPAFDRLGVRAEVVPWGDGADWAGYDGVLIRGAWDYILDRNGFLAWAEGVEAVTRLANSVDVLRWNTDKRYLRDLGTRVPVIETRWAEPGGPAPEVPWDDFVVKPSVSAGARLSARYRAGDDIADHLDAIHATGAAAMLQPYVDTVDSAGETGTYVFGGAVSHSIGKGAILTPGKRASTELDAASHQRVGPKPVGDDVAAFARRVLAAAPPVLYARVDTVPGPDGAPMLMELEVTEPYLFLEHDPPAADRFAAAVVEWLA